MNTHHLALLQRIEQAKPVHWHEFVSLLHALGATMTEGRGSRVRVALNGVRAVFHRPHPAAVTSRSMSRSIKRFLQEAGVLEP